MTCIRPAAPYTPTAFSHPAYTVGSSPTVYAGCENAVGVYGAAGRMQVITVGPVTQGDADAVLEVCRARGLVDAGLYRSEWRNA